MIEFINFIQPSATGLTWLVKQIIEGVSSVAVGIILFTLILKAITLPFDFVSRYQMRKNSVKMEQMRPELEKLQKQYADDKTLYNQKMMALYKKNGYSMWGACLPTLITLAIFIVAINGFNGYSQYKNKEYFYNMSNSYNAVFYSGMEIDNNYTKIDNTGKVVINYDELMKNVTNPIVSQVYNASESELIEKYFVRTYDSSDYSQIQAVITEDNKYTFELVDNQTVTSNMMTSDGTYIINKDGKLSLQTDLIVNKTKTLSDLETTEKKAFDTGLEYTIEKKSGSDTEFYLCLYSTNASDTCYVKILLKYGTAGDKSTIYYNNSYSFNLIDNTKITSGMVVDGTVVYLDGGYIKINVTNAKAKASSNIPFTSTTGETSTYTIKSVIKASSETYIDLSSTYSFIHIETKYGYSNSKFTTSETICSTVADKLQTESAKTVEEKSLQSKTNNYLKVTKDGNTLDYKTWADKNRGGQITQATAVEFLEMIGSVKSAETYRTQINSTAKFLWVDNIWIADSPLSHPVYSQLQNSSSAGCFSSCNPSAKGYLSLINASYSDIFANKNLTETTANQYYQQLIKDLTVEQNTPNGYFILAILTAVVTLLSQLVMNKSQKAQMELQSVDGQGARTQKMMTWMMPILMIFFSFLYSSAFSIYMILSSLISIATTFLINWIVDLRLKKAEVKDNPTGKTVIRGRVYEPKVEEKPVEKKKKKKDEEEVADFMKSNAENRQINKHIRGRKK